MTDTKNTDTQNTDTQTDSGNGGGFRKLASQLPLDRLKSSAKDYGLALAERGVAKVGDRVSGMTGKLTDVAQGKPLLGGNKSGGSEDGSDGGSSSGGSLMGNAVKAGAGSMISGVVDKV